MGKMQLALCGVALAAKVVAADPADEEPRSPDTALALSIGGTAASLALLGAGAAEHGSAGARLAEIGVASLVLTPSLGEYYSGTVLTPGLGLRIAAPIAGLIVGAIATEALPCRPLDGGEFCEPNVGGIWAGIAVATGVFATGVGYDIATAPREARRYNRAHTGATIVPAPIRGSTSSGYGLAIVGRF
jgi:hypothetical protein